MKRVSFIIPVYNCKEFLNSCVIAIEATAYDSFEVILVDDGSTDGSGEICDQLAGKYETIRVFHQNNQGVSSARNQGIEMAEGELIVFLDSDDSFEASGMQKMIEIMDREDSIDLLIYGLSFDYYQNGKMYRRDEMAYPTTGRLSVEDWSRDFLQLYLHNSLSPVWNKIYRRDILIKNHLRFKENMFLYEDLEFVIRYLAYCNTIYNSEKIIYHYRQQEDEGNSKRRLMRIDDLSDLVGEIENAINKMVDTMSVRFALDEAVKKKMDSVLAHLYLVIAREKIAAFDRNEIRKICKDMSRWMEDKPDSILNELTEKERTYVDLILRGCVGRLIANRDYIALRHKIAIAVKNTVLYSRIKRRHIE